MLEMLKRAAKWHWNLLGIGTGIALALLSGRPDVVLPALAAGELAYLGFLGLNPRFQNVLKAGEIEDGRKSAPKGTPLAAQAKRLQDLLGFLSEEDVQRFGSLRRRCTELTQLQKRMQGQRDGSLDLSSFRTESLDKLLWLFLKLLHHKTGIDRFLGTTDQASIGNQLEEAEAAVEKARASGRGERLIASLEESRNTLRERFENYAQATENRELVVAELNKTEQKIRHLCEIGMTTTDPTDFSVQIDTITSSVTASESAIQGMNIGDLLDDDITPPLIDDSGEGGMISFVDERESQ